MAERRAITNLEVFVPRVQVQFHTETGRYEIATKDQPGGQEDTLISCQTYKDIGQPAGTFMIHLADYGRFDRILRPMDLVTIKMSNHTPNSPRTGNLSESRDQLTHATMIGFIDQVRRKILIDPTTGKPNVFCEIRGRDFGKLFVKHQVRYIPWLQDQIEGESMLAPVVAMFKSLLSGFVTGGGIDWIVANNFRKFFSESVLLDVNFGGGKKYLQNCVSYRAQKNLGVIPYNLPVQAQEGSLWQILNNFANTPFNEMWVDTVNNPRLVIKDDENSDFSSPLVSDKLEKRKELIRKYMAKQSETERQRSFKIYGKDGTKIATGEKYQSRSDNSNAYTMLFLRRTPFDQKDWNNLIRYNITNADIREQDLGISDNETYNMFWVYPLLAIPQELPMKGLGALPLLFSRNRQFGEAPDPAKGNSFPKAVILTSDNKRVPQESGGASRRKHVEISRLNAVEKFGFLPMELRTRVWRWAGSNTMSNSIAAANLLTLTLANWYKHNSGLKSGSMTIKGAPDLHVGNVIKNIDENEEYYVEGIANNYVQYAPMTTTVMVTRGHTPGSIEWGNAYREFCIEKTLKPGEQQEGAPVAP